MKKLFVLAAMCAFALTSCHNHSGHSHAEHDHEHDHVHEHAHEAHAEHVHDHDHSHDHSAHEHESHSHEDHSHEGHSHEGHSHEAHAEHAEHAHGEIVLSAEQAAAAGVKTQHIVAGPFATAVRTSGKITADSGTEMVLVARTSGILSWNGRTPSLGQYVSKGKSIGSVSAESMTGGDAATSYRIAYEAALNKYERAKALREQQIISENQFIEAEAQYKNALNAYQATVSQDTKGGASLDAPMNGYISEVFKREGEYVAAGEAIATLNSIASVRLVADLPEKYIALRNRISSANFRLSYSEETFNTSDFNGRMIGVGTSVSDNSAYLPVTFEMNNAGSQMVPGSYAEVWLITEERQNVLSVPESALTEEQGQFFIYQKLDAECYKKLPVKLGERNGKNVEIISGIHGGEEIVTEGAFQVKISAASVIPGHTHNH